MTELEKTTQLTRAINQKFLRDYAISRVETVREDPVGTMNYNTVYDAKNRVLANLGNAKFNADALPFGQAKDKFIAKDGLTVDVNNKKIVNALEGTADYDVVVKKQLDELETSLNEIIDNLGGGSSGTSALNVLSLLASLTSLGATLGGLGLKAGTALSSIFTPGIIGASALTSVLALASLNKAGEGG